MAETLETTGTITRELALHLYREMVNIRKTEEQLARSYADLATKLVGASASGTFTRPKQPQAGRFRKLFGTDKGVRNVS